MSGQTELLLEFAQQGFVELRELRIGARFMFYADDLHHRGPFTLAAKGIGSATISAEARTITRRFTARARDGQMVEREITATVSGEQICALGAQVVPLTADADGTV